MVTIFDVLTAQLSSNHLAQNSTPEVYGPSVLKLQQQQTGRSMSESYLSDCLQEALRR